MEGWRMGGRDGWLVHLWMPIIRLRRDEACYDGRDAGGCAGEFMAHDRVCVHKKGRERWLNTPVGGDR